MTFKIKNIYTKKEYMVYGTFLELFTVKFLIYDCGEWKVVSGCEYVPAEDEDENKKENETN